MSVEEVPPKFWNPNDKKEYAWYLYVKEGLGTDEIAEKIGVTRRRVQQYIKEKRDSIKYDKEEIVIELLEGFRHDLKEAWQLYYRVPDNIKPQVLGIIGKIRGTILDKVAPKTIHQITEEVVIEGFDDENMEEEAEASTPLLTIQKCSKCQHFHEEGKCPLENKN